MARTFLAELRGEKARASHVDQDVHTGIQGVAMVGLATQDMGEIQAELLAALQVEGILAAPQAESAPLVAAARQQGAHSPQVREPPLNGQPREAAVHQVNLRTCSDEALADSRVWQHALRALHAPHALHALQPI